MKITPLDLRNQEFGRTLRGYDPEEVRVFLELVADEFEILIKENAGLTERVKDLDEKIRDYRNMERTLHATMIAAQQSAERSTENARDEAVNILEGARVESEKIVEAARREKAGLDSEIEYLRRIRQTNVQRLKSVLRQQLDLLAGVDDDSVPMIPSEVVTEELPRTNPRREETATAPPERIRPTFSVDDSPLEPTPADEPEGDRAERTE